MIRYRQMNFDDIPAGLLLCRAAGWNQVSRDWELFLNTNAPGTRVAYDDETGNVVGTVATLQYQNRFSWIGMVLVDPAFRKQGIGQKLMEEAIAVLPPETTIKLDATPAGRDVYKKLHFVEE